MFEIICDCKYIDIPCYFQHSIFYGLSFAYTVGFTLCAALATAVEKDARPNYRKWSLKHLVFFFVTIPYMMGWGLNRAILYLICTPIEKGHDWFFSFLDVMDRFTLNDLGSINIKRIFYNIYYYFKK